MARLDVTEIGNELSQPKFEFTGVVKYGLTECRYWGEGRVMPITENPIPCESSRNQILRGIGSGVAVYLGHSFSAVSHSEK